MNLLKNLKNYTPPLDSFIGAVYAQFSEAYRSRIGGHWECWLVQGMTEFNPIWLKIDECYESTHKKPFTSSISLISCEDYPNAQVS